MGNVLAAGQPEPGMALSPPPLVPKPPPSLPDQEKPTEQTPNENNPGTFEELHRSCKGSKQKLVYLFLMMKLQ